MSPESPAGQPTQNESLPPWALDALFAYHPHILVADLLRAAADDEGRFLSTFLGGVRHAPSHLPPPSYLAMTDPHHPAGRLLDSCGHAAWGEIRAAFAARDAGPAFERLRLQSPEPFRRLLAHLWFWLLNLRTGRATDPARVPGAGEGLTALQDLRNGTASVVRSLFMSPRPEVRVSGAGAVVLGYQLDLASQLADMLALALRPGGTSFSEVRTRLHLPIEPESGITSRVRKLNIRLAQATRHTPFTILVSTERKRLTGVVEMKNTLTSS